MSRNSEQFNTLNDAIDALRRYRWRFLVPMFLAAAAVLLAGLVLPRKYKAEAIFERRTDMVLAEIINRGAPGSYQDPRQTMMEELAGKPAVDKLVDDIRPLLANRYRYFDKQAIADDIIRRLLVKSDIATNNIDRVRVAYTADDAVLARTVVNTLVGNYITRTRKVLEVRLKQTEQFFQGEVKRNRELIEERENKKVAFEIDNAQLLPDNPTGMTSVLAQTQQAMADAQQNRDATALRVEARQTALAATPATIPVVVKARNPEIDRIATKLREARSQLGNYVGPMHMTRKHPDVLSLEQEIAELERQLKNTEGEIITQVSTGVNPKHDELEMNLTEARTQLQALDIQYKSLQKQITQMNTQSAGLFPIRSDYRRLSRQVEELQREQAFWEDNLRRVSMAMTAETGNRGVKLDFIKPCSQISLPVSPNLMQLMLAAVAGGLTAGALGVFFAWRADGSISNAEQLGSTFNLPVFGSVSEIISTQQRHVRRIKNLVLFPTSAAVMAVVLVMMAAMLYTNLEKPHGRSAPTPPAKTIQPQPQQPPAPSAS